MQMNRKVQNKTKRRKTDEITKKKIEDAAIDVTFERRRK